MHNVTSSNLLERKDSPVVLFVSCRLKENTRKMRVLATSPASQSWNGTLIPQIGCNPLSQLSQKSHRIADELLFVYLVTDILRNDSSTEDRMCGWLDVCVPPL